MGSLAAEKPEHGKPLSGILIKRGFNYHLIGPDDLQSKLVNELVYEKVVRLTTSAAEKNVKWINFLRKYLRTNPITCRYVVPSSLLLLLLPLLFSLHTLYFGAIIRCLNSFNRLRFD